MSFAGTMTAIGGALWMLAGAFDHGLTSQVDFLVGGEFYIASAGFWIAGRLRP